MRNRQKALAVLAITLMILTIFVSISMISPSKVYAAGTVFTHNVSDSGVDKDGDGLYDYLEIGIEIDVAEAGRYRVSVGELREQTDGGYNTLALYESAEEYFEMGTRDFYLNVSGPMLAHSHFSPTNVTGIYLYETEPPYAQLDYMPNIKLSTRYNWTLFDAPFNDAELDLVVYPNGTIGVGGISNSTHMYSLNTSPLVNSTLSLSTAGTTTTGSAVGTIIIPEDYSGGWPFNSSTANLVWTYQDGLLNAGLDVTSIMPPEGLAEYPTNASDFTLHASYVHTYDGLLDVTLWGETEIPSHDTMLPLNVSDIVALLNYDGNELSGNVTFRAFSSFPLTDIVVFFYGNKSDLHFTGNVTVLYGNYFDMEINSTSLEQMLFDLNSTIPGTGEGSLYNMTDGMVECTQLNTSKTPLLLDTEEIGSIVDYNVTIHGNFTGALAEVLSEMLYSFIGGYPPEEPDQTLYAALESALSSVQDASLQILYYHTTGKASIDLHFTSDIEALWDNVMALLPPTMPIEDRTQVEAMLKIANATAYAIDEFSFNASYSKMEQKLDLNVSLTADVDQLKSDIIPILPDTVPPEMREIVESYLNTTYCTLKSSNGTFQYTNGTGNFEIYWTLEGDFKAQVNHAKRAYIDYLNATAPWMLTWEYRLLNETEIDINNFGAELEMGKDWMYLNFNGAIIQPSKDDVDFIRFKLFKFFNATYTEPEEMPAEFEKLKIVITGGSNDTHTVLLCAPSGVPGPDSISLNYKNMMWQNTTMSSLKELLFQIAYQGKAEYGGVTYYVPIFTNSTVTNFSFNHDAKAISFNVTGTSGTGFSNVTIPRALLYAAPTEWVLRLGDRVLTQQEYNVTENAEYVFIYLNYSHSSHQIEITGTWVVTEFQPNLLPPVVIVLSIAVAIIVIKQRKRLRMMKNYQKITQAFMNKLHQLKA